MIAPLSSAAASVSELLKRQRVHQSLCNFTGNQQQSVALALHPCHPSDSTGLRLRLLAFQLGVVLRHELADLVGEA